MTTAISGRTQETEHYSFTARWLHWASAILIIWATLSGLSVSLLEVDQNIAHRIADFNVSATLVFIPFFIWRIAYRIRYGSPEYANQVSEFTQKMAIRVHYLLYGMTSLVLISGVFMMDRAFSIFHLIELQPLLTSEPSIHFFEQLHVLSSRTLGLLVLLHILAVIKHQLTNNQILKRMI